MRRRTPTIATKLSAIDHIQFEQFCRMEGKTKTETAREAILYYMKAKEAGQLNEHQSEMVLRLKKMEERFSGLLVKLGIGIFLKVWAKLQQRLELNPCLTAKELLVQLIADDPENFNMSHQRTLRRRVSAWRHTQLQLEYAHQRLTLEPGCAINIFTDLAELAVTQ
ncbi:MAG TPA: hypothetical protein V6C76_12870 [Drouetiella sp.]